MTENEAIKVLRQPCYCDYDLSSTVENCEVSSCDKRDATRMAIQALEKQIPKKPLKDYCWHCPRCEEEAYWDTDYGQQKFRYCHNCGQKIDWH
jgi:hypothetical protein